MKAGIYLIQNNTDEKAYVGSSKSLWSRWRNHRSALRRGKHTNCHLQSAWSRDGEDAFMFLVLEECPESDLLERESWWIAFFDSKNASMGYNLWDARRHECSEETRAKLRAIIRPPEWFEKQRQRAISPDHLALMHQRATTPEVLAKRSAAAKGKVLTPEHKAKIGAANSGKSPGTETRSKMSESAKRRGGGFQTGHEVPDEWRVAHSAKMKGRTPPNKGVPMSDATKAKLSASKRGKPIHSAEHKSALAEQMRLRWTPERRAKMSEQMRARHGAKAANP